MLLYSSLHFCIKEGLICSICMTRAYHADHLAVEYLEGKYRVAWVWLLELLPGKLFQDRMHLEHGRLISDGGIELGQFVIVTHHWEQGHLLLQHNNVSNQNIQ